jgi:GTP cyclohydrolase I
MKKLPKLSDAEAIKVIEEKFRDIIVALGLDLTDDNLKNTPHRVAKMYVNELCSGLRTPKPEITVFKNKFPKNKIVVERNIKVLSMCSHHWVPIVGVCHIAYVPNKHVMGLSKFHRIVKWYAKRPQIQERLTEDIGNELSDLLQTKDVAVIIQADHMCVKVRGVEDHNSDTITSFLEGCFMEKPEARNELFQLLKL